MSQLNESRGNPGQGRSSPLLTSSEPRSPVDQSSVTRASESSATHRSKTRVCKQDWDIQENQDLMDVEDQDTEDESNQLLDVPIGVVQLD